MKFLVSVKKQSKLKKNKYKEIKISFSHILELILTGKLLIKVRYKKNFYYLQKAANNGNKVALYHLGDCYRTGNGVKKNLIKAFELYKESAEHCIDGKFRLAICFSEGIGPDFNKVNAIVLYKIAAREGISEAQNNLGNLYLNGNYIKPNLEEAVKLFEKAAENGDKVAQYNLARCYGSGIFVKNDEKKAFELYKKSSKQGNLEQLHTIMIMELELNKIKKRHLNYMKKRLKKEINLHKTILEFCMKEVKWLIRIQKWLFSGMKKQQKMGAKQPCII